VLTATGGANALSFSRVGTELPVGTHRLGALPDFNGGYTVRRNDNSQQVFFADSGSLTITESGARVAGSFKFYASRYSVFAPITSSTVFPVKSISQGSEKLTIIGAFNAVNQSALTTDPSSPSFEMRPFPSYSAGCPSICDTNR
jgi:hypothetical protein